MGKSKLKERIKYWVQIVLLPIYGFSFFMPRDKHIWLFGSTFGNRFADSPRYFYLYMSQHKDEEAAVRPIWISRNKEILTMLCKNGYEAYDGRSLKGIWYCLRGKVYLYDNYPKDISQWLSGGAVKINLWHGIPLKKIQMDNTRDEIRHPKTTLKKLQYALRRFTDEKPSHYIVSTSKFFDPIFSSAFATKRVLTTGYPRTDIFTGNHIQNLLLKEEAESEKLIKERISRMQIKTGSSPKVFLYMPTFRESEKLFFETVHIEELEDFLKENNYLLCMKLHCKSKLCQQFQNLQSEFIVVISPQADPYVYIQLSDVLITDYSSIYFDYLLTNKPIIFFAYDLAQYLEHSREMYFDYHSFTPGELAYTWIELKQAMRNAVALPVSMKKHEANISYEENKANEIYEADKVIEANKANEADKAIEENKANKIYEAYEKMRWRAFDDHTEHASERLAAAIHGLLKN